MVADPLNPLSDNGMLGGVDEIVESGLDSILFG
jgi:hypothetical protein